MRQEVHVSCKKVYNIGMKITVITLFPEMINSFIGESIVKRAVEKGSVTIELINLRDFAADSYGTVDDRPYGGGAGMVMKVDVIGRALAKVKSTESKVLLTTPKGQLFDQGKAEKLAEEKQIVIIAGHYEGYDERIRHLVDEEISLGDFVMTGGEITAAAIIDSVVRLLPGVLKKESATIEESHSIVSLQELKKAVGENELIERLIEKGIAEVRLIEYPHYTRPEEYNGAKVPSILLSGDHKKISEWRLKMAFEETIRRRPDLLE